MSFSYDNETDIPNTPVPWFPGWGVLADLWGQQAFRGPIRGYRGSVWAPTYTFDEENRTGWYQPWENAIGASIAAFLRFYVDEVGTTYRNTTGWGGTIAADNLDANQLYQLPNQSGVIALEDSFTKINDEATSIQKGQPVCLSTVNATGCNYASSDDIETRAFAIASATAGSGAVVALKTRGAITLADWTNVTGTTELTPHADYFLGNGVSILTETPTDLSGYILQFIGRAISSDTLLIDIQRPYLL